MFEFRNLPIHPRNRPKAVASVIMAASAAIVGLMSVAVAHDDAGVRQFFMDEADHRPVDRGAFRATAPAEASDSRTSLTINGLNRLQRVRGVAVRTTRHKPHVAARQPAARVQPVLFASDPRQPAVVSIFEDPTLRRGDAVMTMKGLRVFSGSRTFPYRPEDFTTLQASHDIKFEFRRALIELDQNPFLRG